MLFITAPLFRIVSIVLLALTPLGLSAPAGAQSVSLVVATYNVRASSPDSGANSTQTDLRKLLTRADALILQEVGSDAKKQDIDQVRSEKAVCPTRCRVLYSPGPGDEAIVWHPNKLALKTKGAAVLSDPTAVGNPSVTIPRKYLTWGSFVLTNSTSPEIGTVHLVARPHVDARRAELLQLEARNLANVIRNLGFKKPLIGGDFNVDYNDTWLDPLRNIGMLNDDAYFIAAKCGVEPCPGEPLATFYNTSDSAARSFDQWWFYPPDKTGITPEAHEAVWGSSDHAAVVVTFTVQ